MLSPFILSELERVFSYDRVRAVTKLTEEEVQQYLGYLNSQSVSEIVYPGLAPPVIPSDPDDDHVVHTAVAGQADALCTLNRHFYHPDVVAYCVAQGVVITNDVDLLNFLRTDTASDPA